MRRSQFSLRHTLLATGIAVGLGLSQNAIADTATDDLEITAGLTEALTLSCDSALNFGITRLGELTRGGETTLAVSAETGNLTTGGSTTGVTAGSGSRGVCTIAGSSAAANTSVTVQIGGSAVGDASTTLDGDVSAFSGLDAPESDATLTVDSFQLNPADVQIDANGGTSFGIGATLTIPASVSENNLGGYKNTVTISVNDGFDGT